MSSICLSLKRKATPEIVEGWHILFKLVHKLSREYVKFMENEISRREKGGGKLEWLKSQGKSWKASHRKVLLYETICSPQRIPFKMPGGSAARRELSSVLEGCCISPVRGQRKRREGRIAVYSVGFIFFPQYLLLGDRTGLEGPLIPPCCWSSTRKVCTASSKWGNKLPQALLVPCSSKPNLGGGPLEREKWQDLGLTQHEWCLAHAVPKMCV